MKKLKEYCIHIYDIQGNEIFNAEDVWATNYSSAVKQGKEMIWNDTSTEVNIVCQNCHTDNDTENKKCENCDEKL